MQQGDQYAVRVDIKQGGEALEPADVAGVKVQLGDIVREYPDGDLTYDSTLESWLFPVTQAETLALEGTVSAQVQVNLGGEPAQIVGSPVRRVRVDGSIIRQVWDA